MKRYTETLHLDLDRLICWQMELDVDKCKVLFIENRNDRVRYLINGQQLSAVNMEKCSVP